MRLPYWIRSERLEFPPVDQALDYPNGLLAVGGDLRPERLLLAYENGIFPWYSRGQPILWWSPDPRAVLRPEHIHISRSLRKTLKKRPFELSLDSAFEQVIEACAEPRAQAPDSSRDTAHTWITEEIKRAYIRLHRLGHAHSIECWQEERLVGGLYGVSIGRIFCGESMFSRRPDASKVALVTLVRQLQRWGYPLIDSQVYSEHLGSLGAEEMPRREFIRHLRSSGRLPAQPAPWRLEDQDLALQG